MIAGEIYKQMFQRAFSCTSLFSSSSVVESFRKSGRAGVLTLVDFSAKVQHVYCTAFLMTRRKVWIDGKENYLS